MRRLYRILTLPTPEILDPESQSGKQDPKERFSELVSEANKSMDGAEAEAEEKDLLGEESPLDIEGSKLVSAKPQNKSGTIS